ncbi:hypothetical protein J6590_066744 [Homalodisca vitripennis]|nr:hypothetical protein J6590_066744 [Homalodisca vitripennis]
MKILPNRILQFSRVLSGLPLKYDSDSKGTEELKFSLTGLFWVSTIFLLQEILSSVSLYLNLTADVDGLPMWKLGETANFAATANFVCLQVTAAVVFLSCVRKYDRLLDICGTLEKVYRDLRFTTSEIKGRMKVIVIFTVAAIFLFSAMIIQSLAHYKSTARKTLSVITYLSMVLLYYRKVAFLVHFSYITQSINKGFRMVNVKLKEEIISHIVVRQTLINRRQRNFVFTGITCNYLCTMQKLQSLMNTYRLLCDAVHQANDFYCDQLMAEVFSSFVNTTIMSFYFLHLFLVGVDNVISYGIQGAWILVNACYIVQLINTSTEVTNSVTCVYHRYIIVSLHSIKLE